MNEIQFYISLSFQEGKSKSKSLALNKTFSSPLINLNS